MDVMLSASDMVDFKPGQSITFGKAWDGHFYVAHNQTTPGDFLGPVTKSIAYGATPVLAFLAKQEPQR